MRTDVEGILISQYGAALAMLRAAIEGSSDRLWTSDAYRNRFWHIAYHVLFYTDLYLSPSEEAFVPWKEWRAEANFLGPLPWPPYAQPKTCEPYGRGSLLEYETKVAESVGDRVRALPLNEPSGFPWLPMSRLELHLYSIRHVQHHAGQLIDRIRADGGAGIDWIGFRPAEA